LPTGKISVKNLAEAPFRPDLPHIEESIYTKLHFYLALLTIKTNPQNGVLMS